MGKGLNTVHVKSESWGAFSLRQLRKHHMTGKPTYVCDNCKCTRFVKCTCKRKGAK